MMSERVRWVRCGACGREWPTPWHEPDRQVEMDYTCTVCLHADLAQARRLLEEAERELAGGIRTMANASTVISDLTTALRESSDIVSQVTRAIMEEHARRVPKPAARDVH